MFLPQRETELSERIFNLLFSYRSTHVFSSDPIVVQQGTFFDRVLSNYLIEDGTEESNARVGVDPIECDLEDFIFKLFFAVEKKNKN